VRLDTVVGVIGITNVLRMAGHSPVCMQYLEDETPNNCIYTAERLTSNAVWLINIITIMLQYFGGLCKCLQRCK